jgi:hypothetical protein
MGRPWIDIAAHIDKLEQAVSVGATYELAALYAGISPATFQRWRARAKTAQDGTALARLRDRLLAAEGRAAITWLARIEQAATDGNWQAAAWKLERRYPEQFGRTGVQKVALTDASGEKPLPTLTIVTMQAPPTLTDPEFAAYVAGHRAGAPKELP